MYTQEEKKSNINLGTLLHSKAQKYYAIFTIQNGNKKHPWFVSN